MIGPRRPSGAVAPATLLLALTWGSTVAGAEPVVPLSGTEPSIGFADTLVVPAHVVVPSNSLLMGAPFDVGVIWLTPEPVSSLILLTPPESLEPLELIDFERGLDRGDTMTARVTLRAFDIGWVAVPRLTWAGITEGDVLILAETSLDSVIVASLVAEGAEGLLDLHGAFPLEGRRRWWGWAIAGLALIALLVALWRWRRRGGEPTSEAAAIPAHEAALTELEKLRRDPRGRSGPWKPFYTDLTDTLRRYVARRYGIPAPDFTTYETMRAIRLKDVEDGSLDELQQVLEIADGIKFAKAEPSESVAGEDIERAVRFVRATVAPPSPSEEIGAPEPAGASRSEKVGV